VHEIHPRNIAEKQFQQSIEVGVVVPLDKNINKIDNM
jgi:hypothetical protein